MNKKFIFTIAALSATLAAPFSARAQTAPAPGVLQAAATPTRPPIDLKNPDVARADNLFSRFERFPQIATPQLKTPPVIDGRVNADEWSAASEFSGLVSFATRHVSQQPARFFMGHDTQNVYIAFQLDRPGGDAPKALTTGQVDALWNKEDGVELLISPDRERRIVVSTYVNGAGGNSDGFTLDSKSFDPSRNGNWKIASRVTPRGIEGEVAISKNEFDDVLKKSGATLDTQSWGFNAMRSDLSPQTEQSDWSEMWGSGNYNGKFLGRLELRPDGVSVRQQTLGALDEARAGARGVILNPTAQPLRAQLSYAIYRATRDVREAKTYLYQSWDKVNRIRTTGSDFDEGAAVQLLMGEENWLKNLGRSYQIAGEETREINVPAGGQAPFEIAVQQASGQFIIAAKLTEVGTGRVLWAQTAPVEVKAPVELDVQKRFLTAGGVLIKTDVGGASKADSAILQSTLKGPGGISISWQSAVKNRTAPVEKFIAMAARPSGAYVVETKLVAPGGAVLGAAKANFSKPAPPAWWKNQIGYSREVPSPFTPVKATAGSTSVWGRTYSWSEGAPFPRQIETKKSDLLAAPIEMILVSGGRRMKWKTVSWKLAASTPRSAKYRSLHMAGDFKLALATTVDFDGMMHFSGEFDGRKIPIDSLSIRFPLRREMASHFHAAQFETDVQLADPKYQAGSLNDFARVFPQRATPFAALFWLGGAKGGLQWIAQTDKGWRNPDRKQVMRVLQDERATTLEVSFIGQKTTLAEPLPIDFALNVTPVRDISGFWKNGVILGATNAIIPKWWDEKKAPGDLKNAKDNNITHVMAGGYGWPFHADIWVRGHNRPHFKQTVDLIHQAQMKMIYYGAWGYDINGEEARDYRHDMMKIPIDPGGPDTYWYNPEGPWVDFFMAGLDKAIKTYAIDGIYLDSMPVTGLVADPLLGQTYTDEAGRLHGRWPIWSLRAWALRMQNVFHITHRKDGIVYQHDSSVPNLAIVSLADIRTGGEDAPSRDTLRAAWPPDAYLARYDMHVFGVPMETLWYNWWQRPLKENNVFSMILLHGQLKSRTGGDILPVNLKPNYEVGTTPSIALLKLFQSFDVGSAQWHPYYGDKNWISLQSSLQATPMKSALEPPSLLASSYLHPGRKALVIVSNLDTQDVRAGVLLNLQAAGFKSGAVKVTDAFLNTEIPIDGNAIELDIQKERYRLLLIEATPVKK